MADESACDRMRKARRRLGLEPEDVASKLGLSTPWYYDLETYPDEIVSTVSLAHVQVLARTLELKPSVLVTGTSSPQCRPFGDVLHALRHRMDSERLDADALGDRVGWDIRQLLLDPEEFWNLSMDGLRNICDGVGIDWLTVLANLA